jgi:hypothetical protein
MKKGRYREALQSFIVYRNTELQACRDLYLAYVMLEEEKKWQTKKGLALWAELWTVPRNLRATIAATICMFGQQFCGGEYLTALKGGASMPPHADRLSHASDTSQCHRLLQL